MRRFRILRRLTAVVTQLLLLQLVFASGAGMCPRGNGGAQAAEMHMTGGGTQQVQHHADASTAHGQPLAVDLHASAGPVPSSPASHHAGCNMSCAPASCSAAGHCSVSMALGDAVGGAPHGAAKSHLFVSRDEAPHALNTAPEPPPPRA